MNDQNATSPTMSVDDLVIELTEMLEVSRRDPGILERLAGGHLSICYELIAEDDQISPHLMTIDGAERSIVPISDTDQDADIVLRAAPLTLHDLTSGDLNGREAIMSGQLDIKKAPSLPKLLMMRGLFNQYKKALARGEVGPSSTPPQSGEH